MSSLTRYHALKLLAVRGRRNCQLFLTMRRGFNALPGRAHGGAPSPHPDRSLRTWRRLERSVEYGSILEFKIGQIKETSRVWFHFMFGHLIFIMPACAHYVYSCFCQVSVAMMLSRRLKGLSALFTCPSRLPTSTEAIAVQYGT